MSISVKTRKMLWGRSGNICAMPECRLELFVDETVTDDNSLIGEECHIIAQKPDSPRGDSSYPEEKLDCYNNLILLCANHHKIVDDQPNKYTVEFLKQLKIEHENWVQESLRDYDQKQQREEEIYAHYMDEWVERTHLDEWKPWSSWILSHGQPQLSVSLSNELYQTSLDT